MLRNPTAQVTPPEDRIELAIGQPDPKLLPTGLFHHLQSGRDYLAYGAEQGDGLFRSALATWLSGHYGQPVNANALMITNGSSNALNMICQRFCQPGDAVLVEDPTYFIARRQLAERGLRVIGVPMDGDGVIIEALEELVSQHQPAFFYTIPSFHNPTGVNLSAARRSMLLELSARTGCLVVSDDVYQLLYFDQQPPPPLVREDDSARVLSIGSFSKILAPGLRLGWIQGAPELLDPLTTSALLDSGGGLNPFTSGLVRPLIEDGRLDDYLSALQLVYRQRRDALVQALEEELSDLVAFQRPAGGFFIWASLLKGRASDLLPRARRRGVGFLPGERCTDSAHHDRAMRLCFAYYDEPALTLACRRLRAAIENDRSLGA